MLVYCCSKYIEDHLLHHGGVYCVKRTLDEAMEEIQHIKQRDFELGFITHNPTLVESDFPGLRAWVAVAFSRPDESNIMWRYRYEINEFILDLKRKH